jgi:hypothetical protein
MEFIAELAPSRALECPGLQPVVLNTHAPPLVCASSDLVVTANEATQSALAYAMFSSSPQVTTDVRSLAVLEMVTGAESSRLVADAAALLENRAVHILAEQDAVPAVAGGPVEDRPAVMGGGTAMGRPISPSHSPAEQLQAFLSQVGEPVTPGLIRAPPLMPMGAPACRRRRQPPPPPSRHRTPC